MTTTAAYETHRLADLIPAMTDSEFADLREDIAANGLREPITLYEGKILDGRHRHRACEETGVWPTFTVYDGDAPATFVLSLNVKRRQLTQSQKAMLAVAFLPELEAEAKRRQGRRIDLDETSVQVCTDVRSKGSADRAAQEAADLVGSSARAVYQAKKVEREDPDLAQQVRDGDIALDTAHERVRATRPETGAVRPAVISRLAEQAAGIAMAAETLAINKSCDRMTPEDRSTALDSCKAGLKALNTMAKALGR